jgi:hypothetical protein
LVAAEEDVTTDAGDIQPFDLRALLVADVGVGWLRVHGRFDPT